MHYRTRKHSALTVCLPVDLWVIKIKSPWSFVHVVRRDHVKRAENAREHANMWMFVYSRVKVTRFYDYQTWPTLLLSGQRFVGVFLFFSRAADWLGRKVHTWSTSVTSSHGSINLVANTCWWYRGVNISGVFSKKNIYVKRRKTATAIRNSTDWSMRRAAFSAVSMFQMFFSTQDHCRNLLFAPLNKKGLSR